MDGSEGEKKKPPEGEPRVKRKMKTASQLQILENAYAVETYPSESVRAELSEQLGLSDRQLQMWFCHRRLKDRKPPLPAKRAKKEASSPAGMAASSSGGGGVGDEVAVGEVGNEYCSGSSPFGHNESHQQCVVPRATAAAVAMVRISGDVLPMKRYYEPPQAISELRAISFVEAQLGEPLREDGPILGMEFDPLPPGAFGAPIVTVGQPKPASRPYEPSLYERHGVKPIRGAARTLHEYQFLPEQPSVRDDTYDRGTTSNYFGSPPHVPSARSALSTGRSFMHGNEQVPLGYGVQGQRPSLLPHQGRQVHVLPSASGDYDVHLQKNPLKMSADAHVVAQALPGLESSDIPSGFEIPIIPLESKSAQDEDVFQIEKKRKSEEARIAREVEAHEKRIRKELEKQDILRRKREEQMKKEMERQDRERRKEEERLLREKQREEERFQREQRRELERREKFLQKESLRAEKLRQKEELRKEKEAARLKAANDKATARRIAKESMELIEDERLELMELAASSKGFPSILSLNSEDLHKLELYRDKLVEFPSKSVCLKRPFGFQPWIDSEENIGNLLMVWRFLVTFGDVLRVWPFTLDEFIQAFHDYDSRLLGEIHIALLRSIIKDIEDVARTPSAGLGATQNNAVNPGGGHPHIVEGAYAWGFDIRSWQRHLNLLTWPEILRQFGLSAGFGPKLKKRNIEQPHLREENEGNDGENIVSNLRSGVAAENAVAFMQERGFSNLRKSRHRLTPGTVKFAAFHVLSIEGSDGLTILEVADKIQISGLRDLTTSKTPEASIAAALSRDTKLFERTAPSTYCVRTPYRKDPVDAETILSSAREKIRIFKNGFPNGEDAEDVERDDVERDEDSESDVAEDPEADDLLGELNPKEKDASYETDPLIAKTCPIAGKIPSDIEIEETRKISQNESREVSTLMQSEGLGGKGTNIDQEETIADDNQLCEPWVQGLLDGEYSGLSVVERLNALVALIGVANEGNSIRIILEERMEAANALKKQMWADAQLDKRRMREYVMKMQYTPFTSNRIEANGQMYSAEGRHSPLPPADDKSVPAAKQEHANDTQNDSNYPGVLLVERNTEMQEFAGGTDNFSLFQSGYVAERSRSQLKAYIGHKAEEMYVYRSLPLGQDRRSNRYWQFRTSASQNDPGSGRIFVELRNGCWTLIDTEEGFDALVASLDVRGSRESHLHSMLRTVEVSFKESLRRNLARRSRSGRVTVDKVKKENAVMLSNPENNSICSNISSVHAVISNIPEISSSFIVSLGNNETERKDLFQRYQDFEKWLWQECVKSSVLCAVKYGKKRCNQLMDICDDCCDLHLIDDNHCPSCHRIYKTFRGGTSFSEHVVQCKEVFKGRLGWTLKGLDSSLPLRIRVLKALLVRMEVSVPAEALQPTWSESFRNSWGIKLNNASSVEGLFEVLTSLESSLTKDFLSSDFETTVELLGLCSQSGPAANISMVSVLPWIPQTSSAVALRLMELDSSISYTPNQKADLHIGQGTGNFLTPRLKVHVGRNILEHDMAEAPYEAKNLQVDPWFDSSSGRGRGSRGRGRGRTRGGGPHKRALSSRPEAASHQSTPVNNEDLVHLVGWKGRPRVQGGRKRGRRSVRSRQNPVKRVTDVGNRRDQAKLSLFENTMRSSVPQWSRDETMGIQAEGTDNDSSSSNEGSESSEYDYNGPHAMLGECGDLALDDYSTVFNGKSEYLMEGVDYSINGEEDNRAEAVENDEEDDVEDGQGDTDVDRYINGDSDFDGEGYGEQIGNADDIPGSSSEYSD